MCTADDWISVRRVVSCVMFCCSRLLQTCTGVGARSHQMYCSACVVCPYTGVVPFAPASDFEDKMAVAAATFDQTDAVKGKMAERASCWVKYV